MLDLLTIDEYEERAGTRSIGILKRIFDLNRGLAVIDYKKITSDDFNGVEGHEVDWAILQAVECKIFNKDIFEKHNLLTSKLQQHVAVFSGVTVPEDYALVKNDIEASTAIVFNALSKMFSSDALVVTAEKPVAIDVDEFETLWNIYPKRGGRRVGKSEAKKYFTANFRSQKKLDLLTRAVRNYIGQDYPKDMVRFMRNDYYLDWVDEAEDTAVGVSYEAAVADCQKNMLFPIKDHYEMRDDKKWYRR